MAVEQNVYWMDVRP